MSARGATRPATTGGVASARTRTHASGSSNRREAAAATPAAAPPATPPSRFNVTASGSQVLPGVIRPEQLRSTGQFSQTHTSTGRAAVESSNVGAARKAETVSLARLKVPEPKEWISEAKASMKMGKLSFADKLLDLNEEKEKSMQKAYERYNADRARKKLQRLVNHQYAGSVDILFEHNDTDKDGELDFEEFSSILKRKCLEQFFSRKEQRDVFKAIDPDHSEKVSMKEFVAFLKAEPDEHGKPKVVRGPRDDQDDDEIENSRMAKAEVDYESHFIANATITRGSEMSFTTKAADRTLAQELKKRAEKTKENMVRKIVLKRRSEKNEDGIGVTSDYLLNAFKSCDKDMSGTLSREELDFAFGPEWLNLNVSKAEMDDFIAVADADDDGEVSYKEFIKALQIHDLEPAYNPVMEARERGLKRLHDRVRAPYKFGAELNAMQARAEALRIDEAALAAANEAAKEAELAALHSGKGDKLLLPAQWLSSTKPVPRVPGPGSEKVAGYDGRPVGSGAELFDDIDRINGVVASRVGKRMTHQPELHSYDNSRIGLGTGGVDPTSSLHMGPSDRFTKTSVLYHAPLVYAPNKPVARPDGKCDSVEDAAVRAERRNRRFARSERNQADSRMRIKEQELLKQMDDDQRERTAAAMSYKYLKSAYFKDLRIHAREPLEVMAKKPNWPDFTRTYTTSANTQLRDMAHLPDDRDYGTVHKRDLWQGRFGQTSFELSGGAPPDLHRTSMVKKGC